MSIGSLFGGASPISFMAVAAFGPAGGLVAQLATRVFTSMAQQFIDQTGQQMGLSRSDIDSAQGEFSARVGDNGSRQSTRESVDALAQEVRAGFQDSANAQREMNEGLSRLIAQQSESEDQREARAGGKGGGVGWLRAMARVLGEKLDEVAHEMQDLAGKVNKEDPSTSTEFSTVSQEFNMLMGAVSTSIKSIGEAMGKMTSRQ